MPSNEILYISNQVTIKNMIWQEKTVNKKSIIVQAFGTKMLIKNTITVSKTKRHFINK